MTSAAQHGLSDPGAISPDDSPLIRRIAAVLGDIKFAHTLFALPFALLSAHLAFLSKSGYRWDTLIVILICMVTARTAAMSFNRYIDRDLDEKNIRTQHRSIPGGRARPMDALLVVIICSVIFFLACLYLGFWPSVLGIPTLAYILVYSAVKRYSTLTHLWLGGALAIAPMGAWLAVTGEWSWYPIPLCFGVLFWVAGFDIIYAMQDIEFDRKQRVFSIPARFGGVKGLMVARIFHVLSFLGFVYFGYIVEINIAYWIALGLVGILLITEHAMVKPGDLSRVGVAFFTMNGIISIVLYLSVLLGTFIGSSGGAIE